MMLFLAGLQGIPRVYYEAADLDGCTGIRRLMKITLHFAAYHLFITVMSIINSLQVSTRSWSSRAVDPAAVPR
jgi:multiple sugar transport system permease protein